MMEMLKYLRLAVFVVCIAAFASGCGGGGGGTAEEMPPVMECPQGQVGTYPDCTDPPPTDEQRITEARQEVASILSNAQARAGAASSAAAAIGTNPDATPDQITDANSHSNAAQSALALIVSANTAATLATTPAGANAALADAKAAESTLNASASAISSIQGAVQAAANQRQQREADEAALTGGSSLIRHVRDNRKVYDALLPLSDASIPDGNLALATTANQATFPFYYQAGTTTPGTVYPQPRGTDRGVLAVTITATGGAVSSHSKTGKLTDPGRLHQGFDLKNSDGTIFANAYTDISVSRPVRVIGNDREAVENTAGTPEDESHVYQADPDYLLAGIWLDDSGATPSLQAFAYGNQPIASDSSRDFCTVADVANSASLHKTCQPTTGFDTINGVLADNTDKSYTYRGNVNGAYMADGKASYFKADVSLEADFQDIAGAGSGSIGGEVTNITAGGQRIDGSIELQEEDLTNDLTAIFTGDAAGVVGGNAYNGKWKGRFFGLRSDKRVEGERVDADPDTQLISYTPGLPGSVAGTFYLNKLTGPGGDAAFIGSFGAHR